MPKRARKPRLPDPNLTAIAIVEAVTGETLVKKPAPPVAATITAASGKNPAAVLLGQLGGMKGGLARAKKLSKKRRAEIARKAAQARWKGKHGKEEAHKKTKASASL